MSRAWPSVIGHADRVKPLRDYCTGLMMPCERKSVEPMAAVTAPARTAAQHQSLLHFVGQAAWSDEKVLAKVCEMVLPAIERAGPIEAWIIDDTGFPKKGKHSVGVARQYCGQLGKQDNCQAAVSLSIANRQASLPVRYRLYLPQDWADDAARRRKAHVPEEIVFKTKPEIALEQVRWACEAGLPRGVVLLDAGYGNHTDLRTQISALALTYVAGILSSTSVWAPATKPLPPKRYSGRGRPPTRPRRGKGHKPVSVKQLAFSLPGGCLAHGDMAGGSSGRLSSRFARLRVRAAHRGGTGERRVVADRMAESREGAHEVLALHPAARHCLGAHGRSRQVALAHRARLPGAQAGTRPRPLRRPKLARLPPPRHDVHRSLRLPDLRAGDDSPLSATCRRAAHAT